MESTLEGVLRESDLFRELSDEERERIAQIARVATFVPGDVIFREGDVAKEIFVVSRGRVAVEIGLRLGGGVRRPATIDTVSSGNSFGWTALVGQTVRVATARCVTETEALVLMGSDLERLFETEHRLAWQVMSGLVNLVSGRLRGVRETLAYILAIASHDLRAPLNAVDGYLQLLLEGYVGELTEEQSELLHKSEARIMGLVHLIDNILDLSRVGRGDLEREATSLVEVAQTCLEVVGRKARDKGVRLVSHWPEGLPPLQAEPARLQQTIINMLDNAVRYTPAGGSVTLAIEDADDELLLEVVDSGPGIPEDVLPSIFDDFYQGRDTKVGALGLGLSIAKRIVEDHGGRIWAESPYPESDGGTLVAFALPKDAPN